MSTTNEQFNNLKHGDKYEELIKHFNDLESDFWDSHTLESMYDPLTMVHLFRIVKKEKSKTPHMGLKEF